MVPQFITSLWTSPLFMMLFKFPIILLASLVTHSVAAADTDTTTMHGWTVVNHPAESYTREKPSDEFVSSIRDKIQDMIDMAKSEFSILCRQGEKILTWS